MIDLEKVAANVESARGTVRWNFGDQVTRTDHVELPCDTVDAFVTLARAAKGLRASERHDLPGETPEARTRRIQLYRDDVDRALLPFAEPSA